VTAATARDPGGFRAQQYLDSRGSFEGSVDVFWDAVPGATAYMLGGPGTGTGVRVNGTFYRVTGVSPGAHTWTVATMYPNGILTTPDKWSKATTVVKAVTARYRIVLNGFRVYQESYDDQLNMDGQHDEVYAAAAVAVFERYPQKVVQPTQIVRSALHGDASRGQVQVRAGSVMPSGGIANGDTVPNLTPAAPGGTPSMHTFPLLLWEGTLTDDKEVVSIRPVLWEWDGGTALYDEWARTVPSRQAGDASIPALGKWVDGNTANLVCSGGTLNPNTCRHGVDRPIGLGNCYSFALDSWCDHVVVFTRKAIEAALSLPQAGGIPPGGYAIRLTETKWDTRADYEMYLRFERIPGSER
jgi:hypothetical protein